MGEGYIKKYLIIEITKGRGKGMIPLFKKECNPNKLLFDIKASAIFELLKEDIKPYKINKSNFRQWSCIYS